MSDRTADDVLTRVAEIRREREAASARVKKQFETLLEGNVAALEKLVNYVRVKLRPLKCVETGYPGLANEAKCFTLYARGGILLSVVCDLRLSDSDGLGPRVLVMSRSPRGVLAVATIETFVDELANVIVKNDLTMILEGDR